MSVLPACNMCSACMSGACLQNVEEAAQSLEAALVTAGFASPPPMSAGNPSLGPLVLQPVLLAAEPSLQPQVLIF
jgi:hypothetical protein